MWVVNQGSHTQKKFSKTSGKELLFKYLRDTALP